MKNPRLRKPLRILGFGCLATIALLAFLIISGWQAFGHRAEGARLARVIASPEWKGSHFENPQPIRNDAREMMSGTFHISPVVSPSSPVPTGAPSLMAPPPTGLRATWFGHSTVLLEVDGVRVLTDPVWSARASPFDWSGPKRWFEPLLALSDLPHVDAVVISHDHYDHLDMKTLAAMKDWDTVFVVPLGIGAHLAYWGVPEARIVELDWWQETQVRGLTVTATPARHASGRWLVDDGAKLWAGWALKGPTHRVYYSGDTGLFPAMKDIGTRLGPFDLTVIESGQYGRGWPDWHLGPEQAVKAHRWVQGKVMLPVHWGLFALAYHGWTEPIERALVAAASAHVTLIAPRPGQSIEPEAAPALERWWPTEPWQTAEQVPIVASQVDVGD